MDQSHLPPADDPAIDTDDEPGLLFGRPVEDRSFETVELAAGAALGFALGALIGPLTAVVGALVGAAVGATAAEVVEELAGIVTRTTDTGHHHHPA
jgi:hypothetical protein